MMLSNKPPVKGDYKVDKDDTPAIKEMCKAVLFYRHQ